MDGVGHEFADDQEDEIANFIVDVFEVLGGESARKLATATIRCERDAANAYLLGDVVHDDGLSKSGRSGRWVVFLVLASLMFAGAMLAGFAL